MSAEQMTAVNKRMKMEQRRSGGGHSAAATEGNRERNEQLWKQAEESLRMGRHKLGGEACIWNEVAHIL